MKIKLLILFFLLAFSNCSSILYLLIEAIPKPKVRILTKCIEGDCENGKGKQSIDEGSGKIYIYEGDFKNGFRDGEGILTYEYKSPDGNKFEPHSVLKSSFQKDKKHGRFHLQYKELTEEDEDYEKFKDKEYYELIGYFEYDYLYPGYMLIKSLKTGEITEGFFTGNYFCYHGNCINGFGKQIGIHYPLHYSNLSTSIPKVDINLSYEGDFLHGQFNGYGRFKTALKEYEGEWEKNSLIKGTIKEFDRWSNRLESIYEGEISGLIPNGKGIKKIFAPDRLVGEAYILEGEFVKGEISETGTWKNFKGEILIVCYDGLRKTLEQCYGKRKAEEMKKKLNLE